MALLQQQPPPQQQQTSKGNHRNELPLLLDGVRVVLVSPKTPANIGSVLRAHDVVVVDPRCDPRSNEVDVTSCSSQVMQSMCVMPTLAAALADCTGSIGFTRRAGAGRIVHASLHQLLAQFPAAVPALLTAAEPQQAQQQDPQQQQQQQQQPPRQQQTGSQQTAVGAATVALVFGREESGLLESRSQPSLNLSHAVAVVVSQLFDIKQQRLLAADQQQQQQQQVAAADLPGLDPSVGPLAPSGSLFENDRMRWRREVALAPANQAELEALLQRMAALLQAAGIRSMLLRSQASAAEVRALHGLCKELEGRAEAAQQQQAR
ncbi:tRNA (cytidine/uridine-2'-O-)-methyltransferase TrmJ [Chlorella vulgaris]